MGDAVDEVGLAVVEADLFDRRDEPDDDPGQGEGEGEDADGEGGPPGSAGEDDDPADHEGDVERDEAALRVMGRWNVLRRRKKFVMSVTRSSNAVPRSCG